jgi:hypothetical protein
MNGEFAPDSVMLSKHTGYGDAYFGMISDTLAVLALAFETKPFL